MGPKSHASNANAQVVDIILTNPLKEILSYGLHKNWEANFDIKLHLKYVMSSTYQRAHQSEVR